MKSKALIGIFLFFSTVSFGQTQIKKNQATVKQAEGMYVFLQSSPQAEYEVLGTVKKTGLVWSRETKRDVSNPIKKGKKRFSKL
jgi:hypothetical protein